MPRTLVWGALAAAVLAACCAPHVPMQSVGDPSGSSPPTIEAAGAAFASAEQELLAQLGAPAAALDEDGHGAPAPAYGGPTADTASQPGQHQSALPAPPPAPVAVEPRGQREAAGPAQSRCAVACRALGSMRRAGGRLCALSGAEDARCVRAKRRMQRAGRLVHRACPGCA